MTPLTRESKTLSPYRWELSSKIPNRVSRVSWRNCGGTGGRGKGSTHPVGTNLGDKSAYLDDLRTVDLPQLGEAVVDPFGMSSPLQQVQHVPWGGTGDTEHLRTHGAFKCSRRTRTRGSFPSLGFNRERLWVGILPFWVSLVEQRKLVIQKDSLGPFRFWFWLFLEKGSFR